MKSLQLCGNQKMLKTGQFMNEPRNIPKWHFHMMNDSYRNDGFYKAFQEIGLKGKVVCEIGTGAGLLAIMCASLGAKHVYTFEVDPFLVKIAKTNVKKNKMDTCIDVIEKHSSYINPNIDFKESPNVYVTETLDCGIIGEGYSQVSHDIKRLKKNGDVILPQWIQQYGMIVDSEEIRNLNFVSTLYGYDFQATNELSTTAYFPIRLNTYKYHALTKPVPIRAYKYGQVPATNDTLLSVAVEEGGRADGLVSWFVVHLTPEITISNHFENRTHWHQAFHPFAIPFEKAKGEQIHISMSENGSIHYLGV